MVHGKKIVVVMPAYNAASTVEKTYNEIPRDIVDDVILVDDGSADDTVNISRSLKIKTFVHPHNMGYGGNLKTCFREALLSAADIIIVLHPDYQYTPHLIASMSALLAEDVYDVVLGSRMLGAGALQGGMPRYKYIFNKTLTFLENRCIRRKLSEYHTGYRAYSRKVLSSLPLLENSNDFLFDNQILLQAFYFGFRVGEISCPTLYAEESSSISFRRSLRYGIGVLGVALKYVLSKARLYAVPMFDTHGKRLDLHDAAMKSEGIYEF